MGRKWPPKYLGGDSPSGPQRRPCTGGYRGPTRGQHRPAHDRGAQFSLKGVKRQRHSKSVSHSSMNMHWKNYKPNHDHEGFARGGGKIKRYHEKRVILGELSPRKKEGGLRFWGRNVPWSYHSYKRFRPFLSFDTKLIGHIPVEFLGFRKSALSDDGMTQKQEKKPP